MKKAHEGHLLFIAESENAYLKVKERLPKGREVSWWKFSYLSHEEDRQLKYKTLHGEVPSLILLQVESNIKKVKAFLAEWEKGPLFNVPILYLGLSTFSDFLFLSRHCRNDFYFSTKLPSEEFKSYLRWFENWAGGDNGHISFQDSKWVLLGKFMGGILHDINNPLTIMALNLNLIQKVLGKKEAKVENLEKLEKFSGEIGKAMERINGIIAEVRALIMDGNLLGTESPQMASLQEIIESSYRFCRNEFKRRQIELEMVFDPEIQNQELMFEKIKMVEVLSSLFLTSAQAFEAGNKQTAATAPCAGDGGSLQKNSIKVETRPKGEKVQLLVSDNLKFGKGRQLGLGLSFCRKVRDELKGELQYQFENEDGIWVMEVPKAEKKCGNF